MKLPLVLWDDVPTERRTDRMPNGWRPTWRGCAAAAGGGDGGPYWRCAVASLRPHGLCRKHAERAGVVAPVSAYPYGLDERVGNVISRNVRGYGLRSVPLNVSQFRALSDADILAWRLAGKRALPIIRAVRDTWSDADLIRCFRVRADTPEIPVICNWVGEGVPAETEAAY